MTRVSIDAMGGDYGAEPIVEGTLEALKKHSFSALLVGDSAQLEPKIPKAFKERIEIVHCTDVIQMDDAAANAIRRKESSIFVATDLLKNGRADVLVSAGHSGATMSLATLRLGRIEGVSRPAIATVWPPVGGGELLLLDAGAIVDCTAEHLYTFAIMGYEYAKSVLDYPEPKIGLLSIGEEECKGDEVTKAAHALLQNLPSFAGNIEGDDIFSSDIAVVVCDGFVGNIVLKTSEGVAEAIANFIKKFVKESVSGKIGALLMRKVFRKLKKRMDYAEYGGAPLLGVNGNVIIGHGKSNPKAVHNAIKQGIIAHEQQINHKIAQAFAKS